MGVLERLGGARDSQKFWLLIEKFKLNNVK